MPTIVDKLKELKVVLSEEQLKAVASLDEGLKDQETIDKAVVAAKNKARDKLLRELGVTDVAALKAKLETAASTGPAPTPAPDQPGTPEVKPHADIAKMIADLKAANKALAAQQKETEAKLVRKDQIDLLRSKGFNTSQAVKMHKTLSAQTSAEKDFDAVLKEAETDAFFKGQFDMAASQLKAGTITLNPQETAPQMDAAVTEAIDKAFGLKEPKK